MESRCQRVRAARAQGRLNIEIRLLARALTPLLSVMINEGDQAPDFDLETDEGTRVSLSSLKGKNVVLFFYPKDNTSG